MNEPLKEGTTVKEQQTANSHNATVSGKICMKSPALCTYNECECPAASVTLLERKAA